jgi:secreted trypsin-like serine protease
MTIHGPSRGRGHVWLILLAVLGTALVSVLALPQRDGAARADEREGPGQQITLERSAAPAFQRELSGATNRGDYEPKIVGGTPVPDGKYPFMAFLQIRFSDGSSGSCGGTLIDPDSVLTAAHCIVTPATTASAVDLGVGGTVLSQSQFQVRSATKASFHPKYNRGRIGDGYDAAVLKLDRAVTNMKPIKLNTPTGGALETPGRMLTVAGWGRTSSGGPKPDRMNEVSLPVVSDATAQQAWGSGYVPSLMVSTDSQTGKDAYVGDSGGPLFNPGAATPTQVGIVSYGGFGTPFAGRPTGYTDINNSEITAFIANAAR